MDRLTIFSKNLRRECARHASIATVCRKANVNRQQFNKYLSGSSMPSAAVLQRICAALDLKLDDLFIDTEIQSGANDFPFQVQLQDMAVGLFGDAIKRYHRTSDLRAGYYYCYFPLHRVPGSFVRTLVHVREESNLSSFTRLTKLGDSKNSAGIIAKGRHRGIILSNGNDIYLVGVNRYAPYQMSMMTIYSNFTVRNDHFCGTIMTRSGSAHHTSNFCLVPVPKGVATRQIWSRLGVVLQADLPTESLLLSSMMPQAD